MARSAVRAASRVLPLVLAAVAVLAGCTVTPPAPLVATPAARTTLSGPTDTSQVVVGLDSISGGYNPHTMADQSPVTTALSELLLPSVFDVAPDGTPQLDPTVMLSAQVTSANPFTVTYGVRTDASWSDGTPVDAADFVYLRQQMSSQPGVLDAAGYQLISGITARDNGKVIQVSFSRAYPGWRSLFNGLLPAHLLKDAPGGWGGALADDFPATAGPFDVKSLDQGAGEIVLERSDRYWDKPSVLDQIVLRKTDPAGMAQSLSTGAAQLAFSRTTAAELTQLQQLGAAVSLALVPRATEASVLLRPASAQLSALPVRQAVVAAVDRDALITSGSYGDGDSAQPANALVLAPSMAGYSATLPTGTPPGTSSPASVPQLLTSAGYLKTTLPATGSTSATSAPPPTSSGNPPPQAGWVRNGHPLSLLVAVPDGAQPYLDIAKQLISQLASAGIMATLSTPSGGQLYGQLLVPPAAGSAPPAGAPDIVVGPQPVGGDAATDLASEFGCPAALPGSSTLGPANPLGLCDSSVQPTIQAALTGDMTLPAALNKVEPLLWADDVVVPLFQFTDELAIGKGVTGVSAGAPLAGPFAAAADWNRSTG